MKKLFKKINLLFVTVPAVIILSTVLLLLLTKGNVGSKGELLYQNGRDTGVTGPLELSNSAARFVQTQAIVENKTVFLNQAQAEAAAPDLVVYKNKYFSIFTPGVSLFGIPFYIAGKYLGAPQTGAFMVNVLFAVFNFILVMKVAKKFGANTYASILSAFIFTFGTNALSYTLSYAQHEISTFFVLAALLNALGKRNWITNILYGVILTGGALMDIPNLIITAPITFYILRNHIAIESIKEKTKLKIRLIGFWIIIGAFPLAMLFGWYNYITAGSFTKLAQNIGRTEKVAPANIANKETQKKETPSGDKPLLRLPFQTRSMLNGFYILLLSDERSWLFYSPVLFFGVAGVIFAYRKKGTSQAAVLAISVAGVNIVLYSMFGDPWGGWAFGPRYLIPSAALLAAATGVSLSYFRRNYVLILLFAVLFSYSSYISTLSAVTTNAIPPKVEAVNFKPALNYTYEYNKNFIERDMSSSLLYNAFLKDKFSSKLWWYLIAGTVITLGLLQYALYLVLGKEKNEY